MKRKYEFDAREYNEFIDWYNKLTKKNGKMDIELMNRCLKIFDKPHKANFWLMQIPGEPIQLELFKN